MATKIIGIDLGTTNSAVAVMEGKEPKVIVNEEGNRLTPSVVGWDSGGQVLVGQIAKRQAITNAENTVYSAKRFIGRRYEEVRGEARRFPFEVVGRANGDVAFRVRGQEITPQEVSAHVLRKLKKAAEDYLGEPVDKAVITVPAYFNDSQRQATRDAGRIAGLEVARIVNEPTAAALAYGLDKKKDELIAVYDFGGGTFDISILEVGDNVVQVVSTNGDTHLGGDDVDQLVVEHLLREFRKDTGIDASNDKIVLQRLKDAAEKAKIELSSTLETEISLPFLSADATGPKHLSVRLSRAKLEAMVDPLIERTFEAVKRALSDAGKTPVDIDEVVLVGGATRMPLVQQRVRSFFGKEPHRGVNPDEVVALGAAVQGGVLSGEVEEVVLLDVTPLSLGIETLGGVMTVLIPRNTTIPAHAEETFSTAEDAQMRVDVHVVQGERPAAADNRTLGRFHLEGIQPAPRGVPKIKVSFDIDANGILSVTAKDEQTGKDQRITITASGGLTEQEVQRMVADAAAHSEEDKRRRAEIELRNEADQAIYIARRTLAESQGKVSDGELERARSAIEAVQRALDTHDTAGIHRAMDDLSARMRELASRAATPPPPPRGGPDDRRDVIDAEFEETT